MTATAVRARVPHLRALEAEAVHVVREVVAELERPVLLFSGGKDSIVLLRLAEKAFRPGRFPFPLMHVDTGHNFPEVIEFSDRRVREMGERLVVASVQESIDNGRVVEETGPRASRNAITSSKLCPVSMCSSGNGKRPGRNAFSASRRRTIESLPPEKKSTGFAHSPAISRRMKIASDSSQSRWLRAARAFTTPYPRTPGRVRARRRARRAGRTPSTRGLPTTSGRRARPRPA